MKPAYKKSVGRIVSVVIIGVMVWISESVHSREVIFPEISAICLGTLIAPRFAWNTSKVRMIVSITLCAVCGYAISVYLPLHIYGKLLIAFITGNIVLILSKTGFVPMLSAIILPVVLKTDSITYPLSAVALTTVIVAVLLLLEKFGVKEHFSFTPNQFHYSTDGIALLKRFLIYAVLSCLSVVSNCMIALAPPLVVAFTELCHPESKIRKYPVNICFLMTISAFVGEITRRIFCTFYGLPLFFGVVLAVSIMIVIFDTLKVYIPPMLAITTLAYLVKADTVPYTVQITTGFSVLTVCALLFFRQKKAEKIRT